MMSSLVNIVELSMMHDINKLAVSSQNMANVATHGYKREMVGRVPFDAYLTVDSYYNIPKLVINHKQSLDSVIDFSASPIKPTGNPLNASLTSNGFFVLNTGNEEVYTRNGNFSLDSQGRLVSKDGYIVQSDVGELRLSSINPIISNDGVIWEKDIRIGQLLIVEFPENELGTLVRRDDGTYMAGSSTATVKINPQVIQGFLEGSNVDSAYEIINTVETLRHFEMNQKLLHMQQEMYKSVFDTFSTF